MNIQKDRGTCKTAQLKSSIEKAESKAWKGRSGLSLSLEITDARVKVLRTGGTVHGEETEKGRSRFPSDEAPPSHGLWDRQPPEIQEIHAPRGEVQYLK